MNLEGEGFQACIDRIAEKGKITASEALGLLQETLNRADKMKETGIPDPAFAAAKELADTIKTAAQNDRLDAVRNATIRNSVMRTVDENGGIKNAAATLRSLMHGTSKIFRDSIQSRWRGLSSAWQAAVDWKLRKAGVEKVAVSGEMDRDVARELWAMSNKQESPTKNSVAQSIAGILKPAMDAARDRLNAAGARISEAMNYVAHTSHDPILMRRAAGSMRAPYEDAFKSWWAKTRPRLDEKTFEGVVPKAGESIEDAQTRFGRSVYDALVTGVHLTPDGQLGLKSDANGYVAPAFEGSRNIARKLSQERVLLWKDADSWYDQMKDFGNRGTISHQIMGHLDRSARQVALMERLGTNPIANFNQILQRVVETYRDQADEVRTFGNKVNGLRNVMSQLDGSANIPANRMFARISSSVRTWESMSDLGGVGITHFASIWPTVASEMRHHGISRFEALGKMISGLLQGRGSAERQEILSDLGAYSHGLTRDMWANWQAGTGEIPGRLSAMANTFMKYTGIHYIFDNTQAAVREMLAHQLGRNAGKEFGELEPHLAQMLGKFGINKEEWDLLRSVGDMPNDQGMAYLTPKNAFSVDDGQVKQLLQDRGQLKTAKGDDLVSEDAINKRIAAFKQELSDKLMGYYTESADHSTVTAGVRERAALLGGQKPGTIAGEFWRFMAQFKMWPVAAMNQVIGREVYMSLSKADMAWSLGTMMALSASAGYMRMAINDLALGHPLRDPRDPRTLLAGLAQGGGLGIFGDFMFGEVMRSRFGSGLVSTAAGPVVSDLDSLVHIYSGWLQGKMGWPDLAHFAVRHVPFANLVYLKGALDYLLWYHLYEAASSGWWDRTNRRLIKEQGRSLAGYVPGQGIPYNPLTH